MNGLIPQDAALAIKALAAGNANAGQQKRALEYIMFDLARLRDPSFEDGEKPLKSAHNEGRRYVGLMIAGAIEARPVASVPTKPKRTREAKSDE